MTGPPAPVAAVRLAVRTTLTEVADAHPGALVLVGLSGGADSLALAAATAHECRAPALRAGAVVVDHGLQDGSAHVASAVAARARALGLDPVEVVAVVPRGRGEAAAREARYAAFDDVLAATGAAVLLLGHTRDDQAEQVLLGLARGSGTRSLAGMPRRRGPYARPLLGVTRQETRAACEAEGLRVWDDPMNDDERYARVRARRLLLDLERGLGPGVAAALARTADQLREDAQVLEALADAAHERLGDPPWAVADLADLPRAVRTRVWRRLLLEAGAPAGQLSARHTDACDGLVSAWHGQGPIVVPGPLAVRRRDGRVSVGPAPGVQ